MLGGEQVGFTTSGSDGWEFGGGFRPPAACHVISKSDGHDIQAIEISGSCSMLDCLRIYTVACPSLMVTLASSYVKGVAMPDAALRQWLPPNFPVPSYIYC